MTKQTSSDLVRQYVCDLENSLTFSKTEKLLNDLKIQGMTTVEGVVMVCRGYVAIIRTLYSKYAKTSTGLDCKMYDECNNITTKPDPHENCSSYDEEVENYMKNVDKYIEDFIATDDNRLRGGGNPQEPPASKVEANTSDISKTEERKDITTEVRTKIFPARRQLNVDTLSEDLEALEKQLEIVESIDARGSPMGKQFEILSNFDEFKQQKSTKEEEEVPGTATTGSSMLNKIDEIKEEYWSQMETLENETKILDHEIQGLLVQYGKNRDAVTKYTEQLSPLLDKETLLKNEEDAKHSSKIYDELVQQYQDQLEFSIDKYNIREKEKILDDIRRLMQKDNLNPIQKQERSLFERCIEIQKAEDEKLDSDDESEYDEFVNLAPHLDDFYEYRELPYDADNDAAATKDSDEVEGPCYDGFGESS